MSSAYIKQLYNDFNTKQESIQRYLMMVGKDSKELEDAVYQWLSLLKKKHEVIDQFRKSRQKTVPSSQFALESGGDVNEQASNSDLKELDAQIKEKSQLINHMFQRSEKELVFLTQSYKNLADIVNNLDENFEQSFAGL